MQATPRARHYGAFYGLEPLPAGAALVVVHGNCQAESLRIALAGAELTSVRIPPVHELEAADLPHLDRVLARCDVLISQPVRDGYRGLAVGTGELTARLADHAQVIRVPVVRFTGLYPTSAIIRPPDDPGRVPPLVPYHDLGRLARAAGLVVPDRLGVEVVRRVAAESLEQLRRRERAHATVPVADVFERPSFAQMRTLNHPGNPVWEVLAGRVRARLGLGPAVPLPRPLLDAVHAPRRPEVIEAFGLDDPPTETWTVAGSPVDPQRLDAAHARFYRDHPQVVAAGLRRHRTVLRWLIDA